MTRSNAIGSRPKSSCSPCVGIVAIHCRIAMSETFWQSVAFTLIPPQLIVGLSSSGPEIAKRAFTHRSWRGLTWHVDETYVRVGGKWRYLWRAVDHRGQLVDFRLTARRDAKAAKAFLRQAKDNARLYQPMTIVTDKAPTYARVIEDWNERNFLDDPILHVDRKWRNNIIESDHAALKRLTNPGKGFQSLHTAKATLKGIEAIRTIKRGHVHGRQDGIKGEVRFVNGLFGLAA